MGSGRALGLKANLPAQFASARHDSQQQDLPSCPHRDLPILRTIILNLSFDQLAQVGLPCGDLGPLCLGFRSAEADLLSHQRHRPFECRKPWVAPHPLAVPATTARTSDARPTAGDDAVRWWFCCSPM